MWGRKLTLENGRMGRTPRLRTRLPTNGWVLYWMAPPCWYLLVLLPANLPREPNDSNSS